MTQPEGPFHGSDGSRQPLAAKSRVSGQFSGIVCGPSDTGKGLP